MQDSRIGLYLGHYTNHIFSCQVGPFTSAAAAFCEGAHAPAHCVDLVGSVYQGGEGWYVPITWWRSTGERWHTANSADFLLRYLLGYVLRVNSRQH